MNSNDIVKLFDEKKLVKICAPMVRYSKLQFRTLVRSYECDLCYTPMILADSFCRSGKARSNELTTNLKDSPLVVQFAASTVQDFVGAAYMVSPYCNGVDLNCGCPQRWAKQMGIGCAMLDKPELTQDLIQQCRNRISKPFSVSVKLRILKDIKKTVEICRRLEKAGVSYISVHARTPAQHMGNIDVEALKLVVETVKCPVIGNGGVKNLEECKRLQESTNCKGIMVANALLSNPTLFSGTETTTTECIQKWLDICYNSTLDNYNQTKKPFKAVIKDRPFNLTFQCFHHHLVFMLEKVLPRSKRRIFNNLQNFADVLTFLEEHFGVSPQLFDPDVFNENEVIDLDYEGREIVYENLKNGASGNGWEYDYDAIEGEFFRSKVQECNDSDYGLSNIFI